VVPERLGILGGTFDPVHVGHLVSALEARDALDLDRVLLVVANDPWQKTGSRQITPAEDRFAVVAAAVEGLEGVRASRIEIDRGGPSYTADTVAELRRRCPGVELFLLVGSDVAADLETWKRIEDVAPQVTLVVMERPGLTTVADPPGWRVRRLRVPALDISSSELRERLTEGRGVEFLVPDNAIRCIRRLGLYAERR
jgi:nicotinate-nucleotide adenylyltransferase